MFFSVVESVAPLCNHCKCHHFSQGVGGEAFIRKTLVMVQVLHQRRKRDFHEWKNLFKNITRMKSHLNMEKGVIYQKCPPWVFFWDCLLFCPSDPGIVDFKRWHMVNRSFYMISLQGFHMIHELLTFCSLHYFKRKLAINHSKPFL